MLLQIYVIYSRKIETWQQFSQSTNDLVCGVLGIAKYMHVVTNAENTLRSSFGELISL
jgi:hypothetical protein